MRAFFFLSVIIALTACSSPPKPAPILPPASPELIEKGKYLVKTLAACGFCHGEKSDPNAMLTGGRVVWDKYGEIQAPNITPSAEGIGLFSPQDTIAALRASIAPGDRKFSPEFHSGYEWMSDQDVVAIAGYLQTLPALRNAVPKRDVGFIARNTTGLFERRVDEVPQFVPPIAKTHELAYGKYLLDNVARCGSCHHTHDNFFSEARYLGGGEVVTVAGVKKVAPNITGSEVYGLGRWSDSDIVRFFRSGISPDKRRVDPDFCPVRFYSKADDTDLYAIARFLKSVAY